MLHSGALLEQAESELGLTKWGNSDHVDNEKKHFFITIGATIFLRQFFKDSKRHITDVVYRIY